MITTKRRIRQPDELRDARRNHTNGDIGDGGQVCGVCSCYKKPYARWRKSDRRGERDCSTQKTKRQKCIKYNNTGSTGSAVVILIP